MVTWQQRIDATTEAARARVADPGFDWDAHLVAARAAVEARTAARRAAERR